MNFLEDILLLFTPKKEFNSALDIYKDVMEKTLDIKCEIHSTLLERYSDDLLNAIIRSISELGDVNNSDIENLRQQVPNELERIQKQHRERKFSFSKEVVKGRFSKFKRHELWHSRLLWHTMDSMEKDITEWVSDFGEGHNAVSKFRQGRKDAVGQSVAERITGRISRLFPCMLYTDHYIPKNTIYVDDGDFITYTVDPMIVKLFAQRPLSVTNDNIEIHVFTSTFYIWKENGKIWMSTAKGRSSASVFRYPQFRIHGNMKITLIADVVCTVTKAVNTRQWLKAVTLGIAQMFKSETTKEFHANVKLRSMCAPTFITLSNSQAVNVSTKQAVNFIRQNQDLQALVRENEMGINQENNEGATGGNRNAGNEFQSTDRDHRDTANGSSSDRQDLLDLLNAERGSTNNGQGLLDNEIDATGALVDFHQYPDTRIWRRVRNTIKDLAIALPKKAFLSCLTKSWDEIMEIIAIRFAPISGRVLQKMVYPAIAAVSLLQITNTVSQYVKGKMTRQMLKRAVSRHLIADCGLAIGGSLLIASLVGGPIGFGAALGFGCLVALLDYLFGDKIAKLFIKDNEEEQRAWREKQIAKETESNLKAAYELFDLTEYATDGEVKEAYRLAILKYHPDKTPNADRDVFIALKLAYNIITRHRRSVPIVARNQPVEPLPIAN